MNNDVEMRHGEGGTEGECVGGGGGGGEGEDVENGVSGGTQESSVSGSSGVVQEGAASGSSGGDQSGIVARCRSSTPPKTPRRTTTQTTPEVPMGPRPGQQGSPLIAEPWKRDARVLPALPAMPDFSGAMEIGALPGASGGAAQTIAHSRTPYAVSEDPSSADFERGVVCYLCSRRPAFVATSRAQLVEHIREVHRLSASWLREHGFADALKRKHGGGDC